MKNLYENFNEKVISIILSYQKHLLNLAQEYENLSKTKKYFKSYIENEYALNVVDSQVLKQSMNMILDLSINEFTVSQIGSSKLPVTIFYLNLEDQIMKNIKLFLKELFDDLPIEHFKTIIKIMHDQFKKVFIKRTQRRLHNIIYTTI